MSCVLKSVVSSVRQRAAMLCVGATTAIMLAVPSSASSSPNISVDLKPTFDTMAETTAGTINVILGSVLPLVGLTISIGVGIAYFRKYAKPN